MPKEYLDCVDSMMAKGSQKPDAQRTCAIAFYKKHGKTPQQAANEGGMKMSEEDKKEIVAAPDLKLGELNDIEIFEAGTYRGQTYDEAALDTMVKNFTDLSAEIKPTAVIGHEENQDLLKNSGLPAAGWMTGVKRVGKKLLASFKDVPQVLMDLIGKGAYKRISSEIYNNYNGKGHALRRVAILGGEIPEVKTLQDIAALYADAPAGETSWVTLNEQDPQPVVPAPAAEPTRKETQNMDVMELSEQLGELTEKLAKLSEQVTAKDAKIAELSTESKKNAEKFAEAEKTKKTEDIKRFLKDRRADGRLSPAMCAMGLEQFMVSLDDTEITRFGEGKKTYDLTPLSFMKAMLMAIPKNSIVKLGEVAATGSEPTENNGMTAAERLTAATKALLKANPTMKYSEAFGKAQQDNPELAKEYANDMAIN